MIPLSTPNINGNEWKYVKDCLDSGWVSSAGKYVEEFEDVIRNYTGAGFAVACMNGTVALQVSLDLAGVSSSDIVLAPNLTFVATLNAASYSGAEIILIDACEDSWQMDIDLLQSWLENNTVTEIAEGKPVTTELDSGKKISAIIPVYVLGSFVDVDRLIEISSKYGIAIVEDSTEALGSFKNGSHAGTFGLTGVLSFNGNKIISTGGGGMILTNDCQLAQRARHITTTAKIDPLYYFHDEVGYNYRLVNILAAIGVGQMEKFGEILRRKKAIDQLYRSELQGVGDIMFQDHVPHTKPNCWLFTFRTKQMKNLLGYLNKSEIQSRPFWTPMNNLPMYNKCKYVNNSDVSNKIFRECISVPSSSNLTIEDQERVILKIKDFYTK